MIYVSWLLYNNNSINLQSCEGEMGHNDQEGHLEFLIQKSRPKLRSGSLQVMLAIGELVPQWIAERAD